MRSAFGPLPPGLTLSPSGVISGTPTLAGTFQVLIQVSDSGSPVQQHVSRSFTLPIGQGPPFAAGSVLFWGDGVAAGNGFGTTNLPNPVLLPPGTVASAISAGGRTGYALTTEGHVYAWGQNNAGQLGDASPYGSQSLVPVEVCAVGGCANGPLSDIKAISAGNDGASLALTDAGAVLSWGNNSGGQLGDGSTGPLFGVHIPQPVCARAPVGCASGLTGIAAVSSGAGSGASAFSLALTSSGGVLAWGQNNEGQLGNGTTNQALLPTPVSIPPGDTITAVSAGGEGGLALTTDRTVLSWGYLNGGGSRASLPGLGNGDVAGSATPVALSLPPVSGIAAGDANNSMVVTTAGQVLGWGGNDFGQLGLGTLSTAPSLTPVVSVMPAGTIVSSVASGGFYSLALVQGPTTLTATAAIHGGHPPFFLTATLTSGGQPVAGQTVVFTAGDTVLCHSVTDSAGLATCNARTPTGVHAVAANRGYTVTYAGTSAYGPSRAAGPLVPPPPSRRRRP